MPAFSNARQHIPDVFKRIIVNHNELDALKAEPVIDFKRARTLLAIKRDYRREAEVMLRWNTDKGNVN